MFKWTVLNEDCVIENLNPMKEVKNKRTLHMEIDEDLYIFLSKACIDEGISKTKAITIMIERLKKESESH